MSPSLQHKGIRLFFSVSTSPGLSCHCSQKSCLLFHQLFWEVDAKAASDVSCQRSSASPSLICWGRRNPRATCHGSHEQVHFSSLVSPHPYWKGKTQKTARHCV